MRAAHLLFLVAIYSLSCLAQAVPVTYTFTTNWLDEDLAGTQSQGRFTYDLNRLNEFGNAPGLDSFDDFEFKLRDISFTESDVKILDAAFDQNGNIRRLSFGSNCYIDEWSQEVCYVSGQNRNDFHIAFYPGRPWLTSGAGTGSYVSTGNTTVQRIDIDEDPSEVPEPSSSLLLLAGLVGFIRSRTGSKA